jgi:hypothetical protein
MVSPDTERAEPRALDPAPPAGPLAPAPRDVLDADVFTVALRALAPPLEADLPAAEPLDFVESVFAAPRLVAFFASFAVFDVAGEAADLRTVDAGVELRPADLAGARLALPRLVALLPAELRVEAFRVEVAFAGARLVTAVFADAAFDAVLLEAVLLEAVLLDGLVDAVVDARLVDVLPVDARFAGALRAAEDLVAIALPPVPVVLPVVLLVDAFLAAGLLAPVFLLADLRGLVVAMHLSRGLIAPRGGPPSIAPAACREGDRKSACRAGLSRRTARTTPARMQGPPAAPAAA